MKISSRTPRQEYERRIAPRSLLRTFAQKLVHQWARVCIPPGLRVALYRRMGVRVGRHARHKLVARDVDGVIQRDPAPAARSVLLELVVNAVGCAGKTDGVAG